AAYAFANGAARRTRALELELEPAVIAAAEPARPSTAARAAAKNQTRLCIRYTLRSVRTGSLDGGANSLRRSRGASVTCFRRRPASLVRRRSRRRRAASDVLEADACRGHGDEHAVLEAREAADGEVLPRGAHEARH